MRHSLWVVLLVAGMMTPARAQIRSGSIVGTVVDPSGAAVSGAEVKVTLLENNVSYKTTTNDSGQYTIPYLQLGQYTVSVGKAGFKTADITGVQIATAETVRVPVRLDVGAVTTSVEITADAAGVEVESASVQGVTDRQLVESIPNINGNPFYFATLLAGVVGREELSDGQSVNSFGIGIDGRRNFSAISVNSGQAFTNDIQ